MTKRLNKDDRNILCRLVDKLVQCPVEEKACNYAYAKIFPVVRTFALKQFPRNEMAVLHKYSLVITINSVNVQLTPGGVERFEFTSENGIEVPNTSKYRYGSSVVAVLDEKATELVNVWRKAKEVYNEALKKKRGMYYNFIEQAKTYEQVLEVWPEASAVSCNILSYLPAVVTTETIEAIKADSEARIKAKKS